MTLWPVRHDKKHSQENVMFMKCRNLGNFVVFPTFLAKHPLLCKEARDPSGESWNYLSRRLSCNPSEMIAFTPFRDLFLDLQTCLGTNYVYVSECSAYSLSLRSMSFDQDSSQVMKFVYMR